MFQSNNFPHSFKNNLLVSDLEPVSECLPNKNYIAFINYDHKNSIYSFPEKINNPLKFPQQLLIEAEEKIPLAELIFDKAIEPAKKIKIRPTVTKAEYIDRVTQLKQHIQLGDIYEINYCITFEAQDVTIDPLSIYQTLNAISTASYSALAKFGKQYIISSSPELFLSKTGNTLITKPIKGTARRGNDPTEDAEIKDALFHSLKERTENVMIVDVARNDLSKIAKPGTVRVDKLFDIETYQQVHQMVSTVSCDIKEQTSFNDIINATFPMASMTGAPKRRATQLIDEYEVYNRGPYSGALGYIDENGDFDLSVLIRSIFYDEEIGYLSISVGSAITAMCDAEAEYEECMVKAAAMLKALNATIEE